MSQPLSVAIVTGSLSRRAGGVFNSVRLLALGLNASDMRVGVFGLWDEDYEKDLCAWEPLNPVILKPFPSPRIGFARGLDEELNSFGPDLIHQHGIWQGYSKTVTKWANRVPTVISPHGMLDPWSLKNSYLKKRLAWYGWESKNLHNAVCVHALVTPEAEAIKAVLPKANIATIPNGVKLPKLKKSPRADSQTQKATQMQPRTLLFLGRLHPKKGLLDLINQWHNLPNAIRSKWRVKIVGPDENGHRAELETKLLAKGLKNDFVFTGSLMADDKEAAFRNADAFILPSFSEGLPMSVLEAWSYALPVFMTKACNLSEGFTQGAALEIKTGADPTSLELALTHKNLPSLGQKGRLLVEKQYSNDRITRLHIDNYDNLLS